MALLLLVARREHPGLERVDEQEHGTALTRVSPAVARSPILHFDGAAFDPEPVSAQAERLLYYALVGALEAGLVRTAEDTLTVLRQASAPLGPRARRGSRSRSGGWTRRDAHQRDPVT